MARAALAEEDIPLRDYPVEVAAEGRHDAAFIEELWALFHDEAIWTVFPESVFTRSFQAFAFQVLARLGAAVHQPLRDKHQLLPLRLFRLLRHPEEGPEIADLPDCMKDPWTLQLQTKYPRLEGEELRGTLQLQCMVHMLDIGSVESKHASIRRQVVQHSVQTRRMGFDQASGEWLFQNFRVKKNPAAIAGRRRQLREVPML